MMNMKFKNKNKLSYTFLRVVADVSELDKKTRYYGTDEILYTKEIHMIKAIKENEGISVTGLSDILGVTKGAVSQMIGKLSKKGMIIKSADSANLSRLVLHLSKKGEIAYLNHEKLHENYEAIFNEILVDATDENKAFLKDFLNKLDDRIQYEKSNDCNQTNV